MLFICKIKKKRCLIFESKLPFFFHSDNKLLVFETFKT